MGLFIHIYIIKMPIGLSISQLYIIVFTFLLYLLTHVYLLFSEMLTDNIGFWLRLKAASYGCFAAAMVAVTGCFGLSFCHTSGWLRPICRQKVRSAFMGSRGRPTRSSKSVVTLASVESVLRNCTSWTFSGIGCVLLKPQYPSVVLDVFY